MARIPFFTNDSATDPAYIYTRDSDKYSARRARDNCERLWEIYEPCADTEFLTEIRHHFHARYWEMYLTTSLVDQGYEVSCPKPGPDVGIFFNDIRIWFEATSPERGADGTSDQVPERQWRVAQCVPNEKIVLRYLNSISAKYYDQYDSWIKKGIVRPSDAFVIAINPRQLEFDDSDTQPPRILQAALSIGNPYLEINQQSMKVVGGGYEFRDKIAKSSGASVPTGIFQGDEYLGLSGLLCSRVDVANQPNEMGADFQLVPNPNATVPLPAEFRLRGTYYRIEGTKDGYVATPEST